MRQFFQGGTGQPGDPIEFIEQDDFRYDVSTFETKLGGLLTTAYKPTNDHKLTFRSLINRNSYDNTYAGSGTTQNVPGLIQRQTQLRYIEEELALGQLGGERGIGRGQCGELLFRLFGAR